MNQPYEPMPSAPPPNMAGQPAPSRPKSVDTAFLLWMIVVGIQVVGLFVLLAYLMRRGKNWARITLAVLGGLSVILALVGLGSADPLNMVVNLVGLGLIVGAIYLMFRPDVNPYFARRPPL